MIKEKEMCINELDVLSDTIIRRCIAFKTKNCRYHYVYTQIDTARIQSLGLDASCRTNPREYD